VEGREHATPVNVTDDDHRQIGGPGQTHVGDVPVPQVDLGRAARSFADHHVEPGPQVGQGLQHHRQQLRREQAVVHRPGLGERLSHHDDLGAAVAARLQQYRVHRRLRLDPGGPGLHRLGPADLRPAQGDERVQRHVLGLERSHADPLPGQPTTDSGDQHTLSRVRRGPGHQHCPAHDYRSLLSRLRSPRRSPRTAAAPATATATTAPASPTYRLNRAARRTSGTPGGRPAAPTSGRLSVRPAYTLTPPSRTPSAPAAEASQCPAFGLGCRAPSRRSTRQACFGAGHRQHPGHPGRNQVDQIVQPGRGPAELQIPRRPVPDHRVEGVHRPVAEHPRHPGHRGPEQRRDHGVRGVLGHRLDRGPGQVGGLEPGRIAGAQMRQPLPGGSQVAGLQCPGHRRSLPDQAGTSERDPGGQRGDQHLGHRPTLGDALRDQTEQHRPGHGGRGVADAAGPGRCVPDPFQRSGPATEDRHRMSSPGVADHRIDEHPERDPGSPP